MKSTASAREPSSSQCSATRICRYCGVPLHPYPPISRVPCGGRSQRQTAKNKIAPRCKSSTVPVSTAASEALGAEGSGRGGFKQPPSRHGGKRTLPKKGDEEKEKPKAEEPDGGMKHRRRNRRRKNLMVA